MDSQAIESIKYIIVICIIVITGNELVMSTKSAKTKSINKCILPKHLYNNYIQGKLRPWFIVLYYYLTFYGNEGIISYTKLEKNKSKLKPIRTQHKFLVVFSNLLL